MRHLNLKKLFGLSLLLAPIFAWAVTSGDAAMYTQYIKIGTLTAADSKAALDIASTTKGLLIPRMTKTQRDAITSPPTSLMIFNTTDGAYNYYTGSAWAGIGTGGVVGPASATDNAISVYDGTTGSIIKNSSVTISGSTITGNVTGNAATVTTNANTTGDVTSVGNVTTIGAGKVTNAMLAAPIGIAVGGTGQTTKQAAFDALSPAAFTGEMTQVVSGHNVALTSSSGDTGKVLISGGGTIPNSWGVLSGSKNYIPSDGTFENDLTGVSKFDDGASYTDGTGGSPASIDFSNDLATPLAGVGSLKISKAASSCVGEGVTLTTNTVDEFARGGNLYFRFQYDFSSANYVAGDIQVKAYDVTNGAILPVVSVNGLDTNGGLSKAKSKATVQVLTLTSTASVRLSLYCNTDNASASTWTGRVDEAKFAPDTPMPGAIKTPSVAYTPTITYSSGGMTNATTTGTWHRDGEFLVARGQTTFSGASAAFAGFFISLPAGLTIDTAKLLTATQDIARIGDGNILDSGVLSYSAFVTFGSGGKPQLLFSKTISGTNPVNVSLVDITNTLPFTFGASDAISWRFSVPIVGWNASNLISSNDAAIQIPAPLTATSSVKTPGSSGIFHAHTGNSIALTTGTWDLTGTCSFDNNATSPGYGDNYCSWFGANGADTSSAPSSLSTVPGLTILSGANVSRVGSTNSIVFIPASAARVKCVATTCTIFLGTYSTQTTSANARISVSLNASKIPDFTTFGVYGNFELQTATSGVKTPAATANFLAMTTNSVTLSPGTWRLVCDITFTNSGSNPTYSELGGAWTSANGADIVTSPSGIGAISGLTAISASVTASVIWFDTNGGTIPAVSSMVSPPLIVRTTAASSTIFCVPFASETTPSLARVSLHINAERLQ